MGLLDVCQWLKLGAKTGRLVLARQDRVSHLFIQNGFVTDLREQEQARAFLGFLVQRGWIEEGVLIAEDFSVALIQIAREVAPGRFAGTMEHAFSLLEEPLRDFVIQRMLDFFTWQVGEFQFQDEVLSSNPLLLRPVEIGPLMLDWGERMEELETIRQAIPDDPKLFVIARLAPDSPGLEQMEQRMLLECRTPIRLLDLLLKAMPTEFQSLRILYPMAMKGWVSLGEMTVQEGEDVPVILYNPPRLATIWQQPVSGIPGSSSELLAKCLKRLRTEVASRGSWTGLTPESVPRLSLSLDSKEMWSLKLSADEGFLASRVDSLTTVQQLSSLMGLSKDATSEMILQLLERGILEVAGKQGSIGRTSLLRAEFLLQKYLNPQGSPEPNVEIEIEWETPSPASAQVSPSQKAELLFKEASQLLEAQQFNDSAALLRQSLELDASNPKAWQAFADALLQSGGSLAEAESACQKAIEGDAWNSANYLLLGEIQRRQGMLGAAATALLRALELDHTNPRVHEALRNLHLG